MDYLQKYNKYYLKLNKNIQDAGAKYYDIAVDIKNPQRILGLIKNIDESRIKYEKEKEMQPFIYNLENGYILLKKDENIKWKTLPLYKEAKVGDIVGFATRTGILGKIVGPTVPGRNLLYWNIQFNNKNKSEIAKDSINSVWRVMASGPTAKIGDLIYDMLNSKLLGRIVSDDGSYDSTYTLDNGQKIRKDTQLVYWRVYLPDETKGLLIPSYSTAMNREIISNLAPMRLRYEDGGY
jgi:hypothetical protein